MKFEEMSNKEKREQLVAPYEYATLDPRFKNPKFADQATAANEAVFAKGNVMGIEVTIPELAEKCQLGNIDPQHLEGNSDLAAIEVVKDMELPESEVTFATIRADLDSVGSMALVALRKEGVEVSEEMVDRITKIAESDKFARGRWPGKKNLPSRENLWDETSAGASDSPELAAIAANISDFKLPMNERVEAMKKWLTTGKESLVYREQVEKERLDMIEALESGEINISTTEDEAVALVESKHRAGISLGYTQAPIVVALNPEFGFGDAPKIEKYTIAQYENGHIDLNAAKEELNQLEAGWGGSPTILGSPQGISSELSMEQVTEIVKKHITEKK